MLQANHETMKNMEAKKLNKTNHEQGACLHETLVMPPSNEVFLMDCMEGMKQYPDNHFELAIVDPPYGLNYAKLAGSKKSKHGWKEREASEWDKKIPTQDYFNSLLRVSKNQIIWGGNYFNLPPSRCFVIWDKVQRIDQADCEFAWTSFKKSARVFRYARGNESGFAPKLKGTERFGINIHPTQKPIKLYEWLLTNYANQGDKILDTHVGSGSSRIACHKMGFDFTGYEIDEDYWNAQEQRYKQFKKQLTLF